jgi:predicted aminopeptidase
LARQEARKARRRRKAQGPRQDNPKARKKKKARELRQTEGMKRIILLGTWALLVPAVLFTLSGCRATYVLHAASGQFRLVYGSVPLEQALNEDSLTPGQKEKLALATAVKAFGEKELGLKKTDNYETVYLSDQSPIYVVSAAPKDELRLVTWWFPVVGRMPYLGFFDLDRAKRERMNLLEKGFDTIIGKAEAYSTLGWFQDPITLNLIQESTLGMVETLLHEMTHTTLYVKGQGEFNEGLAVLVGIQGTLLFTEKAYGPGHPLTLEAEKSVHDEALFSSFVASLLEQLEGLYNSPKTYDEKLRERERIFEAALRRFEALKSRLKTARFLGFDKHPLNNAYLLSMGLYHRHFDTFERVFKKNDGSIKCMLAFLKGVAKEGGDVLEKMQK